MIEVLHYKDEKSDKFWRVETYQCMMLANWGRTGTNGRWQLTEYNTEEECEAAAAKLADSKKKKGYTPMPEFDPEAQTYFDMEEYGLHPLTSHPVFRRYFSDELYYDCADEDAPFGSDEGSDTLAMLNGLYKPGMDFADFPRRLIEKEWGLTYLPPVKGQTDEELKALSAAEYDGLPGNVGILTTDQVILATAFGQIKIMGKLDPKLCETAFLSLDRMERLHGICKAGADNADGSSGAGGMSGETGEEPYGVKIMRRDLEKFVSEI